MDWMTCCFVSGASTKYGGYSSVYCEVLELGYPASMIPFTSLGRRPLSIARLINGAFHALYIYCSGQRGPHFAIKKSAKAAVRVTVEKSGNTALSELAGAIWV